MGVYMYLFLMVCSLSWMPFTVFSYRTGLQLFPTESLDDSEHACCPTGNYDDIELGCCSMKIIDIFELACCPTGNLDDRELDCCPTQIIDDFELAYCPTGNLDDIELDCCPTKIIDDFELACCPTGNLDDIETWLLFYKEYWWLWTCLLSYRELDDTELDCCPTGSWMTLNLIVGLQRILMTLNLLVVVLGTGWHWTWLLSYRELDDTELDCCSTKNIDDFELACCPTGNWMTLNLIVVLQGAGWHWTWLLSHKDYWCLWTCLLSYS